MTTMENIQRNTQVKPAEITKHVNPAEHPFLTMLTTPHKPNHSATLITPQPPTISDPRIQKRSTNMNGTTNTVNTTHVNRSATLYDEIHRHHPLPNQQSRSEINTDKTNNIENDWDWHGNSNQTASITTALAPMPIFTWSLMGLLALLRWQLHLY